MEQRAAVDTYGDLYDGYTVNPFVIRHNPMQKLAIINFEKNPDRLYTGLEFQYFNDELYGTGYRLLAYRKDRYVDVYDDLNLHSVENESFDVAGKGLGEHIRTTIENPILRVAEGNFHISFSFQDKLKREVAVDIKEKCKRNTTGMNLLAPIGATTETPNYLPLFFLYNFDFLRKADTDIRVQVDGEEIRQDNFPFPLPKDLQRRYYSRYSMDCHMIEFLCAGKRRLMRIQLQGAGELIDQHFRYRFKDANLVSIQLRQAKHPFRVNFSEAFPNVLQLKNGESHTGYFKAMADEPMGEIAGTYSVVQNDNTVSIELKPDEGWKAVPNSWLTRFLFGKSSLFAKWPKTYLYQQNINLSTLESVSKWHRV
jgi:hypothetical protein